VFEARIGAGKVIVCSIDLRKDLDQNPVARQMLHGLLGYSALAGMVAEALIAWRWRARHGETPITDGMSRYSRLAYSYWVIAFISGGMMVAMARRAARAAAGLGVLLLA